MGIQGKYKMMLTCLNNKLKWAANLKMWLWHKLRTLRSKRKISLWSMLTRVNALLEEVRTVRFRISLKYFTFLLQFRFKTGIIMEKRRWFHHMLRKKQWQLRLLRSTRIQYTFALSQNKAIRLYLLLSGRNLL